MSRPISPFELSASARSSLKKLVNGSIHSARKLTRARILLLLDQGLGPKAIHETLGVSKPTVWQVRKKCEAWGFEATVEGKNLQVLSRALVVKPRPKPRLWPVAILPKDMASGAFVSWLISQ